MSTGNRAKIGVLAIQGSFAEHIEMLSRIGVHAIEVRTKAEIDQVDGLIMPGGESTTIGKLLKYYGLDEEIKKRATEKSLTIWGTCAGAILLAKKVEEPRPDILGLLDITIMRNAYGPQIESFETTVSVPKIKGGPVGAVFIRAPKIMALGKGIVVLGTYDDEAVIVQYNNLLAATFHPELTADRRLQTLFLEKIKACRD